MGMGTQVSILTRDLALGALFCTVLWLGAPAAQAATTITEPNVAPRADAASLPQIEARRHTLLAQMMADPSNLDIAFEYAALSSEAGDLEGAISTLERMLIYAPGLPRLDLELGVLYYRLGAYESAQSYFEAALAVPDVPAEVQSKVAPYLAEIKKRGKTDGFDGSITVGARYQSNANSATSSSTVMLNGIPFVLSNDGKAHPDSNVFVSGNLRYVHDLQSQGDRVLANLTAYGALYKDDGTLNTGVLEATIGPEYNLQRVGIEDATLALYGIATGVVLDGNPYLLSGGLGLNIEKGLGQRAHIGVRTEYRYESYQNSADHPLASDGSGNRVRSTATLQVQINDRLTAFTSISGERRWAQVGYISRWEAGATIGATLAFGSPFKQQAEPWSVTALAGYTLRRFDAPDPLINAAEAETDHELNLNATLNIPLGTDWSLQNSLGYRRVISNYDLDNSENYSASISATKKF